MNRKDVREPEEVKVFLEGDEVRLAGGVDVYSVVGFNEKMRKVLIKIDSESVLIPERVVILVRRQKSQSEKYDYAVDVLRKISRSGLTAGIKTVVESATQTLKDLGEEP